jgi:hypothetical protein
MRLHKKSIVVSEDFGFILHQDLYLLLSTRFWRFSDSSSFFAADGLNMDRWAFGVAYAASGCDNVEKIKGLVSLKINIIVLEAYHESVWR